MRIEPAIDQSLLIDVLRDEYGLSVERLTFVPQGEVAHSYVVMCADSARYYLKVLDRSRLAAISASRLDFYLPLTYKLFHEGHFRYLTYPIKTRSGAFATTFDGAPLILFNYIEGVNPHGDALVEPQTWRTLARHVAAIHNSTHVVHTAGAPTETFTVPFEGALLDGLATLASITDADGEGRSTLRDLLLPRKGAILKYLERLHALAVRARALDPPMALCHTDIHSYNLLMNAAGELFILDWEGAMIAPREHDLFMFTGEHFSSFLAEYRREVGDVPLHADLFAFYFHRRMLEDLTDWIVRILYENTSEEQNRIDLAGIEEECLAGWPAIEPGIARVEEQLRKT